MNNTDSQKISKILKAILRIFLGMFFIVSAILKLLSLDTFELYIYSFNIFGFTMSAFVARLIIAFELLTGTLIVTKIRYRLAWWLALLMLAGFSLLLVYVIIFRNDQNCHCMGDIVEMKPSLSLLKNVVAVILLMFIRKEPDLNFKWKNVVTAGIVVLSFIIPYVLFPMDNFYNLFSKAQDTYDEATFNAFVQDTTHTTLDFDNGKHLVGVVSSGCEYCRISCMKISEIVKNNGLDSTKVMFFIWGNEGSIEGFKTETGTANYKYIGIDPITAVRMTGGHFPLYFFLSDGDIVKSAGLRKLTESDVCEHLEKK